ncbi:hypothetical protein G6F65_014728 [Rhizopus arrhizus]|nr:hypothetical protein G6F65_014728 [Rhizopus arrhizus]
MHPSDPHSDTDPHRRGSVRPPAGHLRAADHGLNRPGRIAADPPPLPPSTAAEAEGRVGEFAQEVVEDARLHGQHEDHAKRRAGQVCAVVDAITTALVHPDAVADVERGIDDGRRRDEEHQDDRPRLDQDEGEQHRRHRPGCTEAEVVRVLLVLQVAGQDRDQQRADIERRIGQVAAGQLHHHALDESPEEEQGDHVEDQVRPVGVDEAIGHQPVVLAMAVHGGRPQDQAVGQLAVVERHPRKDGGDGDQQQIDGAFRVPTEGQRRDEGEAGEEEHQERRLAQAGPGDLVGHRVVAHRGVGQQHPQVADGGEAHHHALHRLRRLAVGELQAGGRDQYLTEGQQRVRQDLPEDRHGIAAVHHHLDATDDDPGQAAEGDTGGHAAQRGRLEAEAAQRRVQHQVVEGNQDHHQQRVQCLHLRGGEPARHLHLLALQDPRRGLLVEQREERRGQREDHQHAQHRAHAFHGFGRMLAAGTVQLQPGR